MPFCAMGRQLVLHYKPLSYYRLHELNDIIPSLNFVLKQTAAIPTVHMIYYSPLWILDVVRRVAFRSAVALKTYLIAVCFKLFRLLEASASFSECSLTCLAVHDEMVTFTVMMVIVSVKSDWRVRNYTDNRNFELICRVHFTRSAVLTN